MVPEVQPVANPFLFNLWLYKLHHVKTGVKKQRELQQQLEIVWLIKFLGYCLEYDYATYIVE